MKEEEEKKERECGLDEGRQCGKDSGRLWREK